MNNADCGSGGRISRSLLLSFLIFVAAGCTTRIGDFSIVSTGTPQYAGMTEACIKHRVVGSDGRLWFLFIPFAFHPTLEDAVDDCMDKGNGDYIERARFYTKSWSFLLFSYDGYSVIGDVGNSKSASGQTF